MTERTDRPLPEVHRALVCGAPLEVASMLVETGALMGAGTSLRVVELTEGSATGDAAACEAVLQHLRNVGASVERERVARLDATWLVHHAARGHDLVMKATDAGSLRAPARLDHADRRLLACCRCPLWFGRRGRAASGPPRQVAALVDLQRRHRDAEGMAERVLTAADAVASASGADMHVVEATHVFGAEMLASRAAPDELIAAGRALRRRSARALREVTAAVPLRTPLPADHLQAIAGVPEIALPRFLDEHRIDVAVIGTRGRRGPTHLALVPAQAEDVIERTACAVVVTPP